MRPALVALSLLLLPPLPQDPAASTDPVRAARIERFHRGISGFVRLAGTDEAARAADWVKARFLEAGLKVEEDEYDVLLSRHEKATLELLGGEEEKPKKLPLVEKGFEWDRDSFSGRRVPPFLAYSPSGSVEAEVVYANYGLPADYAALERLGVDVRDRIVIARYGNSFRGVKLQVAHEHGAAAILLYSDPADDGYVRGDPYPRGSMRPKDAVQRGSALYIFEYPGDPLTPGEPAKPGVQRQRPEAARSLPRLPALPISYAAATPILEQLAGPEVPDSWQGGLPFRYHTGPGPTRLRLQVANKLETVKIRNVYGVIEGASGPHGDFVLIGNHRDSWVHGGIDPATGTACMLEVATVLGEMARNGSKPDYTIRLASWDGEEFGVLGSTEYGEDHAKYLREHLIAYINVDSPIRGGSFGAAASPELRGFVRESAKTVRHPDSGRPLADDWKGEVGLLGGGSDFMVFLSRFATPCLSFSMSGRTGVYHSAYDTHWFVRERVDPGFRYHAALTRILLQSALTLATKDTDVFDPAESVRDCVDFLNARKADLPAELHGRTLDLAREVERLAAAARDDAKIARRELARTGQSWLDEQGLFERPWFHNLFIAPGRRTGYAALLLPGLSEALDSGDAGRIERELGRIHDRLAASRERLRSLGAGR